MQAQPPNWHTKEFSMLPYLEGASHLTPLLYKMCTLKKVIKLNCIQCVWRTILGERTFPFSSSPMWFFFSLKKKRDWLQQKGTLSLSWKCYHATLPPHAFSPPMDEHQEWASLLSSPPSVASKNNSPPSQPPTKEHWNSSTYLVIIIVVVPRPPSFHIHPLLDKLWSQ